MALSSKAVFVTINNKFLSGNGCLGNIICRYAYARPKPEHYIKYEVKKDAAKNRKPVAPENFRFVYPEFLPDPDVKRRNYVREKLERSDMIKRRSVIDLPEFYVGSILSVTTSDPHSQTNSNKFVGICIEKEGCGLRANFTLRNVIDKQGIEIRYNMYDPTLQQVQVLRLEKRIDSKLLYLRNAPEEHSTVPLDMEPEYLPEGSEVPVNDIKVEMKDRPWDQRWWLHDIKGVVDFDKHLKGKERIKRDKFLRPFDKYDLMKDYRETIPEEEQNEVWSDVYSKLHQMQIMRRKMSRKKAFSFPKKVG